MAVLLKKRVFNPGKRRLTARQKLFFGSKRQRVAAAKSLSGKRVSKRTSGKRVRNVGEIVTLSLPARKRITREVITNPMPAKKRAVRRRRRATSYRAATKRVVRRHRRRNGSTTKVANPTRRRTRVKTVTKYRYRNPSVLVSRRRYARRRRNPSFMGSDITKVAGILGGATLTNVIAKQLPSKYTAGTLGYATLTAVAFGQGYIVKKFLKNQTLGEDMMIGGLVLVAMKLISDLFPSVSLPFSLNGPGLGLIGNSSFTVPQVPIMGSMGRFQIAPNYQQAINAAAPQLPTGSVVRTMNGINQSVTTGGNTASRRVGRLK